VNGRVGIAEVGCIPDGALRSLLVSPVAPMEIAMGSVMKRLQAPGDRSPAMSTGHRDCWRWTKQSDEFLWSYEQSIQGSPKCCWCAGRFARGHFADYWSQTIVLRSKAGRRPNRSVYGRLRGCATSPVWRRAGRGRADCRRQFRRRDAASTREWRHRSHPKAPQ
jgi:hypothetical protein